MRAYQNSYPQTLLIRTSLPTFSSAPSGSLFRPSNRMQCLSFIPETASVMEITAPRDSRHLEKGFSAKTSAEMAYAEGRLFKINQDGVAEFIVK